MKNVTLISIFLLSAYSAFTQSQPEAPWQKPAFVNQTRAPEELKGVKFTMKTLAVELKNPWAVAPLPEGGYLITQRTGQLRWLDANGTLQPPISLPMGKSGNPLVFAGGQGGLLDLALDPNYKKNSLVWFTFVEWRDDGEGISVGKGVFKPIKGEPRLDSVQIVYRTNRSLPPSANYGSRIVFRPDGNFFVSVGDRFDARAQAQDPKSDIGKVLLIKPNGESSVWSLGHRNIQGMFFDTETSSLYTTEHGARGGDELNRPKEGLNYGWPIISYGIEYSGAKIGDGITQKEGMEQPLYYWDPVIAPSGLLHYSGDRFAAWKGSWFVGGLRGMVLVRLSLDKNDKVTGQESLLLDLKQRIRDVRQDLDGAILILTDDARGKLIRIE